MSSNVPTQASPNAGVKLSSHVDLDRGAGRDLLMDRLKIRAPWGAVGQGMECTDGYYNSSAILELSMASHQASLVTGLK